MPWWAGNPLAVGLFAAVAWLIGLLSFRNLRPNEPRDWRAWNYIILLIGGFGIWGALVDTQKEVGEREKDIEIPRYEDTLRTLQSNIKFHRTYLCETKFVKSEYSPVDFDERVREQNALCDWFQKVAATTEALNAAAARTFKIDSLGESPEAKYFADHLQMLRDSYRRFDESRERLTNAESKANTTDLKFVFNIFAPILLAVAFGLSLAKAHYVP